MGGRDGVVTLFVNESTYPATTAHLCASRCTGVNFGAAKGIRVSGSLWRKQSKNGQSDLSEFKLQLQELFKIQDERIVKLQREIEIMEKNRSC